MSLEVQIYIKNVKKAYFNQKKLFRSDTKSANLRLASICVCQIFFVILQRY